MTEEQKRTPDLYKKWSKAGGIQRFCAIRPFFEANKLGIDVGQSKDNHLVSHTEVWVNALEFAAFLEQLLAGRASAIYGKPEYTYFGGTERDGKTISRMFALAPWNKDNPAEGFRALCLHQEGERNETGAFMAKRGGAKLSEDSIKLTLPELAELSYRLRLGLQGHTLQEPAWMSK